MIPIDLVKKNGAVLKNIQIQRQDSNQNENLNILLNEEPPSDDLKLPLSPIQQQQRQLKQKLKKSKKSQYQQEIEKQIHVKYRYQRCIQESYTDKGGHFINYFKSPQEQRKKQHVFNTTQKDQFYMGSFFMDTKQAILYQTADQSQNSIFPSINDNNKNTQSNTFDTYKNSMFGDRFGHLSNDDQIIQKRMFLDQKLQEHLKKLNHKKGELENKKPFNLSSKISQNTTMQNMSNIVKNDSKSRILKSPLLSNRLKENNFKSNETLQLQNDQSQNNVNIEIQNQNYINETSDNNNNSQNHNKSKSVKNNKKLIKSTGDAYKIKEQNIFLTNKGQTNLHKLIQENRTNPAKKIALVCVNKKSKNLNKLAKEQNQVIKTIQQIKNQHY